MNWSEGEETRRRSGVLAGVALSVAVFAGCVGPRAVTESAIRVGTYNIRLNTQERDPRNDWADRRDDLVSFMKELDLDVFGMQEVCPEQAAYFREKLADWEFVGDHREADRVSGEASPVFYRKSRFEALRKGTFWLSETPDVPASKSWNTCCTRVCSYLVLKDRRTGKTFCFANTHTDHVSAEAREKGMLLIIERMKEFGAGAPIVFTGDHNNTEIEAPSLAVARVLKNALYVTETPPEGPWRTWNGWRWREHEVTTGQALELSKNVRNLTNNDEQGHRADWFYFMAGGPRIDYIWVSDGVKVRDYATRGDARPGTRLYPSDHFPVTATVELP